MSDKTAFAHFAKSRKRTRNNGIFQKWKPTTSRLGTKVEKRLQRIAKCCARNTTELNLGYEKGNKFNHDMSKNRFLDKKWQKSHLKKIKESAGNRYTPELNVELPIADIFDGISRTENFYISIRKHYGKLNREFGRVSQKYENEEIQRNYKILKNEIFQLSKLLDKLKEYNTREISWVRINSRTKKASESLWKLSDKLREEKDKTEQQKTEDKQEQQRSVSEKIGSDIHYLYEAQKELRYFEQLSSSTKAKLSNSPFLLLTGLAGTGKTHLLCDVIEDKIASKILSPLFLFLANYLKHPKIHLYKLLGSLDCN